MYTTSNKCPGKTWEEREKLILAKCKPLAIREFSLTEFDDTLEDFIHNFLARYNGKYTTAEITEKGISGTTQCSYGKLRSLIDIFLICKHYFPECTLKEVKTALYANLGVLSSHVCGTIRRRVYWIHLGSNGILNHSDLIDEFGLTIKKTIED